MRFAYADPPYYGLAKSFYGDPTYDNINAHAELATSLVEFDGWAYSLTSTTLRDLLPLFPSDARVAAWVKPFCSYKPNVNPAYAWEPIIFKSGRRYRREDTTVRDWCASNIALEKGLRGAKPREMCYWLFDLLAANPSDEFTDMFPGSGEVTRAWENFKRLTPITEQLVLI